MSENEGCVAIMVWDNVYMTLEMILKVSLQCLFQMDNPHVKGVQDLKVSKSRDLFLNPFLNQIYWSKGQNL